jgi:hypothetical protein
MPVLVGALRCQSRHGFRRLEFGLRFLAVVKLCPVKHIARLLGSRAEGEPKRTLFVAQAWKGIALVDGQPLQRDTRGFLGKVTRRDDGLLQAVAQVRSEGGH